MESFRADHKVPEKSFDSRARTDVPHQVARASSCWPLIKSACRKLAVAISEENYPLAAQLSSEKQCLSQDLPPVSQYTFHQLQELQKGLETGDVAQQYLAVRKLGADHIKQTGCSAPGTTACLHTLHEAHMLFCCVTCLFFPCRRHWRQVCPATPACLPKTWLPELSCF